MRTLAAIVLALSVFSSEASAAPPDEPGGIRIPDYTNRFSRYDEAYTGQTTFKCSFSDAAHAEVGHIKSGGAWASAFAEANDNFTFDAATGAYRSHGDTTMMNVVRQGDSQSDLVAHVPGDDPLATVIRIQAYGKPITFFMVNLTNVFAGTCVKL